MSPQSQIALTLPILLSPIVVAIVMIGLCSLLKEPHRQQFSAIFLAGAGAAYLSGGFGLWEFGFCAIITLLAYLGLQHYKAIAIGWGLHTCWDIAHHYYGNPIIPFAAASSIGCAVCDLGLAAWYLIGAPSIWACFQPYSSDKTAPSEAP
jgi:Na+/proline symporter